MHYVHWRSSLVSPGSQHDVYDMQFTGTATLDCEAGPSVASHDQAAIEDRRLNHRRLGYVQQGREEMEVLFTLLAEATNAGVFS